MRLQNWEEEEGQREIMRCALTNLGPIIKGGEEDSRQYSDHELYSTLKWGLSIEKKGMSDSHLSSCCFRSGVRGTHTHTGIKVGNNFHGLLAKISLIGLPRLS